MQLPLISLNLVCEESNTHMTSSTQTAVTCLTATQSCPNKLPTLHPTLNGSNLQHYFKYLDCHGATVHTYSHTCVLHHKTHYSNQSRIPAHCTNPNVTLGKFVVDPFSHRGARGLRAVVRMSAFHGSGVTTELIVVQGCCCSSFISSLLFSKSSSYCAWVVLV